MLRALFWKPYSRLLIVGDNAGWSIDEDAKALKKIAAELGLEAHITKEPRLNVPQAVHYTSQFSLIYSSYKPRHRISVDYYHGKPGQQESFRKCFEALKEHHRQIARVRVSTREMEDLIKSSGISQDKVMRIPIGVDTNLFAPQTQNSKHEIRKKLGIPEDAIVIGSFQKDGVGHGEGNEPKLIKGPDIFVEVISKLKTQIPNLWVLLSGPARGYVKNELTRLGIPYTHKYLKNFRDLPELYDALDLYMITSREEGGPKACLESMAKGVPLVTTEVGQCKDLVVSGENGIMVPIDDAEGLQNAAMNVISDKILGDTLAANGLRTARENNFYSQLPLWREYLEPLID